MDGKREERSEERENGSTASTNDTFRIDRLTLKNFRCFEEKTIDFHPRFNVLIGDNGSGKTTAVEGLAKPLGGALYPDVRSGRETLEEDDVRCLPQPTSGLAVLDHQFPASVTIEGMSGGHPFTITQSIHRHGKRMTEGDPYPLGLSLPHIPEVLPVVALYGADRYSKPPTGTADNFMEPESRLHGYVACLAAAPDEKPMLAWIKTLQAIEDQEKRPVPVLGVLKGALGSCVPRYQDLKYLFRYDELRVLLSQMEVLRYPMLSDGQRAMLAMVADLVRRASTLNPHLGADAARETPGVVLIDEIDLHLHPSWQRHVVDDLKRAFPKVQFIVTTHSPFIIQSLEPGELISLDDREAAEYSDQAIEDIAEYVQGVKLPRRGERYRRMVEAAERYYAVLQQADQADPTELQSLKSRLDELSEEFSDDPAYVALLRAERQAAGMGDGER